MRQREDNAKSHFAGPMMRSLFVVPEVRVERGVSKPLPLQIWEQMGAAIRSGELPPGARLPSSRTLARLLRVSRNTMVAAFERLIDEGLVEAKPGSGMRVRGEGQRRLPGLANLRNALRRAHYPVRTQPFQDPDGTAMYFNVWQSRAGASPARQSVPSPRAAASSGAERASSLLLRSRPGVGGRARACQ